MLWTLCCQLCAVWASDRSDIWYPNSQSNRVAQDFCRYRLEPFTLESSMPVITYWYIDLMSMLWLTPSSRIRIKYPWRLSWLFFLDFCSNLCANGYLDWIRLYLLYLCIVKIHSFFNFFKSHWIISLIIEMFWYFASVFHGAIHFLHVFIYCWYVCQCVKPCCWVSSLEIHWGLEYARLNYLHWSLVCNLWCSPSVGSL